MSAASKKVTINIPEGVLQRARAITGRGITETIVEGLLELDRRRKRSALRALRGRVLIDLDLKQTRK